MKDQTEKLISEIERLKEMAKAASHDPLGSGSCEVVLKLSISEANLIVHGLEALEPIAVSASSDAAIDKEHNSPYKVTVEGMLSPDYKERFKAEYQQTKIRYEKLKAFNTRIEAAHRTSHKGALGVGMPMHDCPDDLLREQQSLMGQYLHVLETRAVIEGIELL